MERRYVWVTVENLPYIMSPSAIELMHKNHTVALEINIFSFLIKKI